MDTVVCSRRVYKYVWLPVIENNSSKRRSLPTNPHDKFAVHGSDKSFSVSWLHSVGNLFTDHVVLYYTKGLCRPLSGVYHSTGRKRKGKVLEVPCKYNYYCGPTVINLRPSIYFCYNTVSPSH